MENKNYMGDDDLIYNPTSRLPVCLCLDVSGSMAKDNAIVQLNEGVAAFYEAIKSDEQASISCEIAVVTFGAEIKVVEEFSLVENKSKPNFTANGGTPLAHAVEECLDLLASRKRDYKNNGVDYYQPWLVLITDGKPGDNDEIPAAQARTKKLLEEKKLVLWPLVVGNDENQEKYSQIIDVLNGFSPKPKALHLKNLKFKEFFEWLGKSIEVVSRSKVGDTVKLDSTNIDDWAEI